MRKISENHDCIKIEIDVNKKFQTIDNFGASACWTMDPIGREWPFAQKEKIADLLFSIDTGIGLSLLRFNIGAGSAETDKEFIKNPWRRPESFKQFEKGDYDWSKHEGQRWFLKAAKERGVDQFLAFSNSPPVWATQNGHGFCNPDETSTNLKPGYEEKYAEYLADILMHFRDEEGIEFKYISPVNEPIWAWDKSGQEGCRYSNEDAKKVIKALYGKLKIYGLDAEIDAIDSGDIVSLLDDGFYREYPLNKNRDEFYKGGNNGTDRGKYREYIKDFLSDQEINQAIGNKLSAHSYWTDKNEEQLKFLRGLVKENIDKYSPTARYWMSEYCIMERRRDLGIDPALHMAKVIHHDLTILHASAWHWWLAVSECDYKDGLLYTDYSPYIAYECQKEKANIIESKMLWAMGNFSRFIRPGSKRIELAACGNTEGLLTSAYIDETNKNVIVVIINESNEDKPVLLKLGGKVTQFTPYVTSSEYDLKEMQCNDSSVFYYVKFRSVTTLVCEY